MFPEDIFDFRLHLYRNRSLDEKHGVLRSDFLTDISLIQAYVKSLRKRLRRHPDILATTLPDPLSMITNNLNILRERALTFHLDATTFRAEWLDLLATLRDTIPAYQDLIITLSDRIPELRDWPQYPIERLNLMEQELDVLTDPHFSVPKHIADWVERYAELRNQANAGNPQALAPLVAALTNPERTIRVEAAHLLREIKDQQSIEPLIHTLHDPDWEVRVTVIDTLAVVGDNRAVAPLLDMLTKELAHSSSPGGAAIMIDALCRTLHTLSGSQHDPVWEQCVMLLLNNLKDPKHAADTGTEWGFCSFPDRRALAPLIATIKAVPELAFFPGGFLNAIEEIGGPEAEAALAEFEW
jgi:hypothetical protein